MLQADAFEPEQWRDQLQGAVGVVSCLGGFGSNDFMLKVLPMAYHPFELSFIKRLECLLCESGLKPTRSRPMTCMVLLCIISWRTVCMIMLCVSRAEIVLLTYIRAMYIHTTMYFYEASLGNAGHHLIDSPQ